ncbi:hypothetical protein [Brevundimonas sp. NPDC058933]|uniref:hypothetical protein n=1 Tax=Brevundimonas sp. NPDC058933 TaxID=3346673 RepID=UPI003BEED285
MNKFRLTALASAVALVSLSAAPAMATPFPATGTVTGQINFSQSITITCNFSATATVVGSDVHLTGLAFSGGGGASGFCGTLVNPNSGPWIAVGAASHPSTIVTITGAGATTVLGGNCSGSIVADVTDNPSGGHYIDIAGPQVLSGTPSNCTVNWATLDAS